MRKILLKDGIVFNIVVVPDDYDAPEGYTLIDYHPSAEVGNAYDGGQFTETQEQIAARQAKLTEAVNTERDRRITAGFTFGGKMFDFDTNSKQRVTGAATLAKFAVAGGAQEDDLRWLNPNVDFSWIAQDNSLVTMDAQTCSAFGDAAAIHEQAHVLAARALKDTQGGIPDDYTDDQYWP